MREGGLQQFRVVEDVGVGVLELGGEVDVAGAGFGELVGRHRVGRVVVGPGVHVVGGVFCAPDEFGDGADSIVEVVRGVVAGGDVADEGGAD